MKKQRDFQQFFLKKSSFFHFNKTQTFYKKIKNKNLLSYYCKTKKGDCRYNERY